MRMRPNSAAVPAVKKKEGGGGGGGTDERGEKRMAYLIVSEGVTAMTASIIPAPSPAKRLRGALTLPLDPQSIQRIDRS